MDIIVYRALEKLDAQMLEVKKSIDFIIKEIAALKIKVDNLSQLPTQEGLE